MVNLDRGLSPGQRAEAAAFSALVDSQLAPALVYSGWCEGDAFAAHTRAAVGGGMPFPLSYFVPRAQRKAVVQHFAGTTASQVGGQEWGVQGACCGAPPALEGSSGTGLPSLPRISSP